MRRALCPGNNFLNLLLTAVMALFFAPKPGFADSQSGSVLVVHVEPEASMTADSAASWNSAGEFQSLPLSLQVMIRLNRGTIGELGISLSEGAWPGGAVLLVETEAGWQEITTTPITLRSYSNSGTFNEMILMKRPTSIETDSPLTSLKLWLTSSDSTIAESQLISLPTAQ